MCADAWSYFSFAKTVYLACNFRVSTQVPTKKAYFQRMKYLKGADGEFLIWSSLCTRDLQFLAEMFLSLVFFEFVALSLLVCNAKTLALTEAHKSSAP